MRGLGILAVELENNDENAIRLTQRLWDEKVNLSFFKKEIHISFLRSSKF